MNQSHTASHFNVFTVEEFDAPTQTDKARKAKSWTKIGVAFPHKEGTGFNIQLKAYPVNGSLVVLPAEAAEDAEQASALAARTARR
jgi:hypothetical protein